MVERATNPNFLPVSEQEPLYTKGLVGLQARLLLGGEALNPQNTSIQQVTETQLESRDLREQTTYKLLEKASKGERQGYWQGREENNFEEQKKAWVRSTAELIGGNSDYFHNSNKGKDWSAFFSKLGINTNGFNQGSAEALYNKYFTGVGKGEPVRYYVAEVVGQFVSNEGQVDYQGLEQNLEAITWLANIFGATSSEVISQLIDAEIKALNGAKKTELVSEVNKDVGSAGVLRINKLERKEEELLEFLWSKGRSATAEKSEWQEWDYEPPKSDTSHTYKWNYEHPQEPREFPVQLYYNTVAKWLIEKTDSPYKTWSVDSLAHEMQKERSQLISYLDSIGIGPKELDSLTLGYMQSEVLSHYKNFVQEKYGVRLPELGEVHIVPISGKISELFNPKKTGLAFVIPECPYVFLDFDVIERHAAHMSKSQNGYMGFTREQLVENIRRILREIKPHEYTHLMGEIGYWHLKDEDIEKQNRENPNAPQVPNPAVATITGRVGVEVIKPKDTLILPSGEANYKLQQRGGQLMEAVTVQLTKEWAEAMNSTLDVDAYKFERQVLDIMVNQLSRLEDISKDEAFKMFVKAYFTRDGLRDLAFAYAGRRTNNGQVEYLRKDYFSHLPIVYALMNYEAENENVTTYDLTKKYLTGRLTADEKQELLRGIDNMSMGPKDKERLRNKLNG